MCKNMKKIITIIFIVIRFYNILALNIGDSCRRKTDQIGTCSPLSSCKYTLQNLKEEPEICRYAEDEAIVCCPTSSTTTTTTTTSTTTRTTISTRFSDDKEVQQKRISVKKCEEYSKLTYEEVTLTTLSLLNNKKKTKRIPKCDYSASLIVGGESVKLGEFPHMAAIGYKTPDGTEFDCGGTLISERYILTAAHCVTSPEGIIPKTVRLGTIYLNDTVAHVDYPIEKLLKNSIYKSSRYNDIALIKLAKNVEFTRNIRPACLWTDEKLNFDSAVATGFGSTEAFGSRSDSLQKVLLKIYDNKICNQTFAGDRRLKSGILDSHLCVGDLQASKDTCQGDSGGPLSIIKDDNRCLHYVVGITSFGKVCGSKTPAVYTKVSSYLSWIENIVWNSQY